MLGRVLFSYDEIPPFVPPSGIYLQKVSWEYFWKSLFFFFSSMSHLKEDGVALVQHTVLYMDVLVSCQEINHLDKGNGAHTHTYMCTCIHGCITVSMFLCSGVLFVSSQFTQGMAIGTKGVGYKYYDHCSITEREKGSTEYGVLVKQWV